MNSRLSRRSDIRDIHVARLDGGTERLTKKTKRLPSRPVLIDRHGARCHRKGARSQGSGERELRKDPKAGPDAVAIGDNKTADEPVADEAQVAQGVRLDIECIRIALDPGETLGGYRHGQTRHQNQKLARLETLRRVPKGPRQPLGRKDTPVRKFHSLPRMESRVAPSIWRQMVSGSLVRPSLATVAMAPSSDWDSPSVQCIFRIKILTPRNGVCDCTH